ncbi:MAG: 2-oxoacid:ferredoxin oxidoreductase subunit beta [Desulfohalobiaceae bacterium]|nr:2-oxoacid:ferredoxin oxidoreductase subunit beta [Desulfohalobiaceae bacterium]
MAIDKYMRERFFPHIWCPGCGHGTILNNMLRAVDELQLNQNEMVMVSGIGCSSRISGYVDFHSLHTLHGRALAFATGIKMSQPNLSVICPMGDGDALAIGGNHFIHACRRNMDITAIVMNNRIYGMTGGQYSPLSGSGITATTAPQKTIDREFDITSLSLASGATFVARTTAYHYREITKYIKEALQHPGFSVVEILSQCPTHFGRRNKLGDAPEMLKLYKQNTTRIGSEAKQNNPELIERGIFRQEIAPEYCAEYAELINRVQQG